MRFELQVALRFLQEGRVQTALIIAGIGTGVGVIIFLSALIAGLQASIIERTLGTQAHVVLQPPEEEARPQLDRAHQDVLAHVQRPAQRLRTILGWPRLLADLRRRPDVTAATPTVTGNASRCGARPTAAWFCGEWIPIPTRGSWISAPSSPEANST
jgi:lipoprotein-releasing system permease protein